MSRQIMSLVVCLSLLLDGCGGLPLSLPNGTQALSGRSQEIAIQLAFKGIEAAFRLVQLALSATLLGIDQQRERQKLRRAQAEDAYSGHCLAQPVLDDERQRLVGDLRGRGQLLVAGIRLLTEGRKPVARDILIATAMLVENGVDRDALRGALVAAETGLKVLSFMQASGTWTEVAKGLDLAMLHYLLGVIHAGLGDVDKATASLGKALSMRRDVLGGGHLCVAAVEHQMARLYMERGDFKKADPLYAHALKVRLEEKEVGAAHPDTVRTERDIGDLFVLRGDPKEAEDWYGIALKGAEKTGDAALVLEIQQRYGRFLVSKAAHAEAERILTAALARRQKSCEDAEAPEVVAECNKDVVATRLALGQLHLRLNHAEAAEEQYEQAERLIKDNLPKETGKGQGARGVDLRLYAQVLEQRGDAALRLGKLDRAQALFDQAAAAWQNATSDRRNAAMGGVLLRKGRLLLQQGRAAQAEAVLQEALSIHRKKLGKAHPRTGEVLAALGEAYGALGKPKKAEEHFVQAEAALMSLDPFTTAQVLLQHAALDLRLGRRDEALKRAQRSFLLSEQSGTGGLRSVDEDRHSRLLDLLRAQDTMIYALAADAGPVLRQEALPIALTVALARKGRSLDEVMTARRNLCASAAGDAAASCQTWQETQRRLSNLGLDLFRCEDKDKAVDLRRQIQDTRRDLTRVQRDMDRLLPQMRQYMWQDPVHLARGVLAALEKRSVLVEFVALGDSQHRYLALVLQPGNKVYGKVLDPGLEAAVDNFSRYLDNPDLPEKQLQQAAAQVHRMVLDPLREWIQGDKIYLSLDEALHRVPFAALYDPKKNEYLIDDKKGPSFVYLNSGRDLLRQRLPAQRGAKVVVFAHPTFDPRSGLNPLDSTKDEITAIKRRFPRALVYSEGDATKEALLGVVAPAVLHIATHGDRLEDNRDTAESPGQAVTLTSGARGAGIDRTSGLVPTPREVRSRKGPAWVDDLIKDAKLNMVLLTAGAWLKLKKEPVMRGAGGRRGHSREAPQATSGEATKKPLSLAQGLVSAWDVAGMKLWGTQLVVLSACKMALGRTEPGQGMYGMHRALLLAGAETVVSALWSVDDHATGYLMERYYDALSRNRDRVDALTSAARQVKRRPEWSHPNYWAPFVIHGSSGPLQNLDELLLPAEDEAQPQPQENR